MTPRIDVQALEARATAQDAANLTLATGLSRFPVYRDSLDDVIGTVHIRDVTSKVALRALLPLLREAGVRDEYLLPGLA